MGEIQYERAYERLRDKLVSGSVKPGERLIEQALANALEVNRGDIRQAFSRLLTEGLVERGEKGGIFAQTYSEKDLDELTETRLVLETAAATLAVSRAHQEDIDTLREIIEHMELMAENGYEMGFNEADLRFHDYLVKSTCNARFYNLYRLANVPITFRLQGKTREVEEVKKSMKKDAAAHREIFEAIKQRDTETVIALLVRGLEGDIHS